MEEVKENKKDSAYGTKHATIKLLFGIFTVCCSLFIASQAEAATLYFSPSSGSYNNGQAFTVSLYVSSADQAMNATQAIINFPTDKLSVQSVSKTGSVLTLWVQDPAYSNVDGTIQFAGVIPNPGFTGRGGRLLSVTFKAINQGTANLSLTKGSVLANDGLGTQILTDVSTAVFNIYKTTQELPSTNVPEAPKITSVSHLNQDKWYNNPNPVFNWPVPKDVTSARILSDKSPASQPTELNTPAISEKKFEKIEDGIWYFHAQLKNNYGWSAASHFRFQIDTVPPESFAIKFIESESDNPQPVIILEARDALSGIDYYKIKIGEGDFFSVPLSSLDNNNHYILPLQEPGTKTVTVQAYDKAGNYTTASEQFTVDPINTPKITEYPERLMAGEPLTVKGESYPDIKVAISIQITGNGAPKNYTVQTNNEGKFNFLLQEGLKKGVYRLWAQAIDGRGAKSYLSDAVTITVEMAAFIRIGTWTINLWIALIPLLILIALLLFIIFYGWRKIYRFKEGIQKEVHEAEEALQKVFESIKEEIRAEIKIIENVQAKRTLTDEEEAILSRLKKNLDALEKPVDLETVKKVVKKELEDIGKELK